jgi:hypothetical protein
LKTGAEVAVVDGLSLGCELAFTVSQYFDGDPANLNSISAPATRQAFSIRRRAIHEP